MNKLSEEELHSVREVLQSDAPRSVHSDQDTRKVPRAVLLHPRPTEAVRVDSNGNIIAEGSRGRTVFFPRKKVHVYEYHVQASGKGNGKDKVVLVRSETYHGDRGRWVQMWHDEQFVRISVCIFVSMFMLVFLLSVCLIAYP